MSDNTEKNRAHWNEASKTYNTQFSKTIQQIIDEIQARKDWIGVDWVEDSDEEDETSSSTSRPKRTVRLLDYACGTGLVSRALASYVTQCVGIDLTEGMVLEYNLSASNQGIPEEEMHAVVGNLISTSTPPPEHLCTPAFYDFDIAVVGLGFHHFDDPALAAKRLSERLKPGGVLMIIDFLPHVDPSSSHCHPHSNSPGHEHNHDQGVENGKGKEDEEGKGHAPTPYIDHHHPPHPNPSLPMSTSNPTSSSISPNQIKQPHPASHTVTHHGFSSSQVESMFTAAGVGKDFSYITIGKGIAFHPKSGGQEMKRSVFFARGVKE